MRSDSSERDPGSGGADDELLFGLGVVGEGVPVEGDLADDCVVEASGAVA